MADTSSGRMAFVQETVVGVTPVTPGFSSLDFTSETMSLTKNFLRSAAVNPNRVVTAARAIGGQTGGAINFELTKGTELDALIAALLGNTFTGSPSISKLGGVTQPTYTFERQISSSAYRRWVGSRLNTLDLTFQPEAFVTASLGIIGASMTSGAAIIAGATYAAPSTGAKLASTDLTTLAVTGGVTGTFDFESISLQINNNMTPSKRLGPSSTRKIRPGQAFYTGTMRVFLDDNALNDAWLAGTPFGFEIQALNGGAGYGLKSSNTVITSYSDANPGGSNEFIADIGFEGVLDAGTATSLVVTKYGA